MAFFVANSSCKFLLNSNSNNIPYVSEQEYRQAIGEDDSRQAPSSQFFNKNSENPNNPNRKIMDLGLQNLKFKSNNSKPEYFGVNSKENSNRNSDAKELTDSWEKIVDDELNKSSEPYQENYLKIVNPQKKIRNRNNELLPKEVLRENDKPRLFYVNPINPEVKNPPNNNTPYPTMLGGVNPQPSNQYYNPYSSISQIPVAQPTNILNSTEIQDPIIQLPRWQDTDYYYAEKVYY